jgi:hypothetical protein
VQILIDYGEFETALADRLTPDADGLNPTADRLRRLALLTGRLFCCSWHEAPAQADFWANQLERGIRGIAARPLPQEMFLRASEGYAYYGLYPETYIEAARRFFRGIRPTDVTCIGIRTIGASLSAAVSAELEEQGCRVESHTVRCHGHPFDRRLLLDPALEAHLRMRRDGYFAIVDEGPGPSGSTLCCVAARQRLSLERPTSGSSCSPATTPTARSCFPKRRANNGPGIASTSRTSTRSGGAAAGSHARGLGAN